LVNRAKAAIATVAYFWSRRLSSGRIATSSSLPGTNPSVLLPFLQRERSKKWDAYWNTIFPGSKRLITVEGSVYGDNTDVRPPAADELGPSFALGGGGGGDSGEPFKLTLDGVFFVDGGFAGPNQLGTWDHLVAAREAYLSASALARSAPQTPAGRADFFARVDKLSGLDTGPQPNAPQAFAPPPPRPLPRFLRADGPDRESIRKYEQQSVGKPLPRGRGSESDALLKAPTLSRDREGDPGIGIEWRLVPAGDVL
jgi:hypothetical protein